jgi:ribonuclease P protein component
MKSAPRLTSDMVAEVMTQGRAVKSASFLFKYAKGAENNPKLGVRFGFIASKKNFPTAVERNSVRRRGKAALRAVLKKDDLVLDAKTAHLCAFIFNKEVSKIDHQSLTVEIKQILEKSGILVKP